MKGKDNYIKTIISICHGNTEISFAKTLIRSYIEYKYDELFHISYMDETDNPKLKYIGGNSPIQLHSIVKNALPFFDGDFFKHQFENKEEFLEQKSFFFVFIDKNEIKNPELIRKEDIIIDNNAEDEIKEILKKISPNDEYPKELFQGSKLIYFNKGIEKALKILGEQTSSGKKKPKFMIGWITNKIKKCTSSKDIRKIFSDIKKEESNINELFDSVDEILEKLEKELNA